MSSEADSTWTPPAGLRQDCTLARYLDWLANDAVDAPAPLGR
jgi:hypothetical protein